MVNSVSKKPNHSLSQSSFLVFPSVLPHRSKSVSTFVSHLVKIVRKILSKSNLTSLLSQQVRSQLPYSPLPLMKTFRATLQTSIMKMIAL